MTKPQTLEELRERMEAARTRKPFCVYCRRNLKDTPTDKLMLIASRTPERLACRDCPEAIEVKFS